MPSAEKSAEIRGEKGSLKTFTSASDIRPFIRTSQEPDASKRWAKKVMEKH